MGEGRQKKDIRSALNNRVILLYMVLNLMLDLSKISAFFAAVTVVFRVRPRFFDQVGNETIYIHLVKITIFSLNNVIVRLTKFMNNLLEHLKFRTSRVIFLCKKLVLWCRDGDISWTVTFRGHYFSKWATFRGHSQRVTSRGHYFSKWVTSRGQF